MSRRPQEDETQNEIPYEPSNYDRLWHNTYRTSIVLDPVTEWPARPARDYTLTNQLIFGFFGVPKYLHPLNILFYILTGDFIVKPVLNIVRFITEMLPGSVTLLLDYMAKKTVPKNRVLKTLHKGIFVTLKAPFQAVRFISKALLSPLRAIRDAKDNYYHRAPGLSKHIAHMIVLTTYLIQLAGFPLIAHYIGTILILKAIPHLLLGLAMTALGVFGLNLIREKISRYASASDYEVKPPFKPLADFTKKCISGLALFTRGLSYVATTSFAVAARITKVFSALDRWLSSPAGPTNEVLPPTYAVTIRSVPDLSFLPIPRANPPAYDAEPLPPIYEPAADDRAFHVPVTSRVLPHEPPPSYSDNAGQSMWGERRSAAPVDDDTRNEASFHSYTSSVSDH